MKQKSILLILAMSLLLSGCSLFNRSYISVEPHREQRQTVQTDTIMASDYLELLGAMEKMIESGTEVAAIKVPDYPEDTLEYSMKMAIFRMPSSRLRSHMGASGKKWSRAPVRKVGRTMNRNTLSPTPSTTASVMTRDSIFLLEIRFSSHCSNLEGWLLSSSG